MTERELGEALLRWDASGKEADPQRLVREVLAKDQRRVRVLAGVTAILWLIAAVGIPLLFATFVTFIFPKVEAVLREMITHQRNLEPEKLNEVAHQLLAATMKLSILLVCGSVAALLLAAWGTVALVFAARRSTLKQVNANLAVIAEELRQRRPQQGT